MTCETNSTTRTTRQASTWQPAADALLLLWISAHLVVGLVITRVKKGMESEDRGEVLGWVVLAVGAAAIAAFILTQVRGKAEIISNNICTNADPTTC